MRTRIYSATAVARHFRRMMLSSRHNSLNTGSMTIYRRTISRGSIIIIRIRIQIHTSRIRQGFCMRQLDLFDRTDYEKLEKMDSAVDRIRGRYGIDSVMRAAFAGSPVDHMSGGIRREKRTCMGV